MSDVTPMKDVRSVIKFCVSANMTPVDTYKFISRGKTSVQCSLVYRWHKRFTDGETGVKDKKRSGRPPALNEKVLEETINQDRRKTVRELGVTLGVSKTTVHKTLTEDLKMNKVSARWVPRLLRDEEKERRVQTSSEFLERVEKEGDTFLHRIITMDETYLYLYEPETKQESMIWKHTTSPPPKKARTSRSAKKFMFIFWMDHEGILLSHVVPAAQTVNADYYQKCNGECQYVLHYWYTAWPDHKPPESPDKIIELVKEVDQRRYSENTLRVRGPVVVHCSAGIGRTGCFIAISVGMRQLREEHSADILGTVCSLRIDRGGMIQTHEQYYFVHQALDQYEKELAAEPPSAFVPD